MGFFKQKSNFLVRNDHVLAEAPFKGELLIKQVAFTTGVHPTAKIQVAILLDVSNSMDGLIQQAKAQLWNMVHTMGDVRCAGMQPQFEVALYEYGRSNNDATKGFVKQLHPFTTQLDAISNTLFNLTTNGGDEYCSDVIVQSADQLAWDKGNQSYRVIFIAGNESFRQGPVNWIQACEKAREKDIIINTIYCGDRNTGLQEYWNLGDACGKGNFTCIDKDANLEDIATPYDSMLFVLNDRLNGTYIAYGLHGESAAAMQADVDAKNYAFNKSAAAKRIAVKGKKELYKNEDWDLVDAYEADKNIVQQLDKKKLPEALQHKSSGELLQWVQLKKKERDSIQQQIADLSVKRSRFLAEVQQKQTGERAGTLEREIETIIRNQVKLYNMEVLRE